MMRASRWCANPARRMFIITQMPISGSTSNAIPKPIAGPRPDEMKAMAMRPSIRKYTISAAHTKTMSSWVRSTRDCGSVPSGPSNKSKRLDTDGKAGAFADAAHRQQHAGHERCAIEAVVADGQRLALGAQQHLLMRDEPGQPHRVHGDAGDDHAACAGQRGHGRIGVGRQILSRLGDQFSGAYRGARRRVGLVGMVQFDHLDRLEESGRFRGESHRQHRTDREVRGDQHRGGR